MMNFVNVGIDQFPMKNFMSDVETKVFTKKLEHHLDKAIFPVWDVLNFKG
jgi:hypothetical protein